MFKKFFSVSASIFLTVPVALSLSTACSKKSTDTATTTIDYAENGQQVSDAASSVDEMGGGTAAISSLKSLVDLDLQAAQRIFSRYGEELAPDAQVESLGGGLQAFAACAGTGFGSCSSKTITRTFADCTVGLATFSGAVSIVWGGAATTCALSAIGDYITRYPVAPGYTVTGLRGATLTVSASGAVGQRLTWSSGSGTSKTFTFTNDGIRRVFQSAGGTTLFDLTTTTNSAVTVTGTARSSRTMTGGSLRVTDNLKNTYCDFTPSNVIWTTGCNCPISGSFTGTCSGGETSSLTINSCTTGTITVGSSSSSITFDRCAGI